MITVKSLTQQLDLHQPNYGSWIVTYSCGCTETLWEPYFSIKDERKIKRDLYLMANDLSSVHKCGVDIDYSWSKGGGLVVRS